MKMHPLTIPASVVSFGLVAAASLVALRVTAGPLSPPSGAVSSTYKTLSEVEPRTAINATNTPGDNDSSPSLFKITQPGSYYLAGNVTGVSGKIGIEIVASGVTLDLAGFSLVGVPGSRSGIRSFGELTGLIIRNGHVRGWGEIGVEVGWSAGNIVNPTLLEALVVSGNVGNGIRTGRGCVVRACSARENGEHGFDGDYAVSFVDCQAISNAGSGFRVTSNSSARGCTAWANGQDGISIGLGSVAVGCTSSSNNGSGFTTSLSSSVLDCSAYDNLGSGIRLGDGSTARGNTCGYNGLGSANTGYGIHVVGDECRVENNQCDTNDAGILVAGHRSRIDGNSCMSNGTGFDVDGLDNLIIRNTASASDGANYSIAAGNSVAPRVGVVDSDGWSGIGNADHPWANFGH
ncbi:MAG: right-handed parallel beta-helix repeat-containing protein [Phycisphaerales bacterium]|jgi:hypothetical protein|nr:right-handed parallel beta-helix repeat-containing protein [Phycisphaerales bacterium]